MFYYLHELEGLFSPLRVFQYITVRAVAGAGTAFLISVIAGPWLINRLKSLSIGECLRKEEAPALYAMHLSKEGTPTMGGILIIASMTAASLMWAIPANPLVLLAVIGTLYMGCLGLIDDFTKIRKSNSAGIKGRTKLLFQVIWAAILVSALFSMPGTRERLLQFMAPFIKRPVIADIGLAAAFVFVALVVMGASNAVNLTDGLDGLAIGCSSSVALSYMIFSYVAGHAAFADYLNIPRVEGAGEIAVFCGCMMGACLGFLWHNCHPAAVFMGDTGSLALGGAMATVAVIIKQELTLIIVGGVFVMEAVSVILQVASFKLRGKRIFAMAPLHHHFEMRKWSETQVTVRFWILSIIFAFLGVLTLKIR